MVCSLFDLNNMSNKKKHTIRIKLKYDEENDILFDELRNREGCIFFIEFGYIY